MIVAIFKTGLLIIDVVPAGDLVFSRTIGDPWLTGILKLFPALQLQFYLNHNLNLGTHPSFRVIHSTLSQTRQQNLTSNSTQIPPVLRGCCLLHQVLRGCCLLHQVLRGCCLLHQVLRGCCLLHQVLRGCCLLHQVLRGCCLRVQGWSRQIVGGGLFIICNTITL